MRNFNNNRTTRYADIPENLGSDRCQEKIDAILDDPNGYKVTDEYNHKDVRAILRNHFGIKCVYCESSPIATSTFRIDHYRPKKNIKGVPSHKGYYWLAYEWTNLLQSCQSCNGKKSNYFPLKMNSPRVDENTLNALEENYRNPTISPLNTEIRLLLQPELDKVELHFYFKSNGEIKSDTEEGTKSIECYDLQRDDLVLYRKTIRDNLLEETKIALKDYEIDLKNDIKSAKFTLFRFLRNEFRKLKNNFTQMREYSLFCFYMLNKYEDFIVSDIRIQEHKDLLKEAYNLYKTGTL